MINPLLKLLGTEYEMELYYNPYISEYVVKIRNRQGNKVDKAFSILEAETINYDVLLCVVEQCILSLQRMTDN